MQVRSAARGRDAVARSRFGTARLRSGHVRIPGGESGRDPANAAPLAS